MVGKIVLLETSNHTLNYLKIRSTLGDHKIIACDLEAEDILDKENISYSSSSDFESRDLYLNLDKNSIELAKKFLIGLKYSYEGIELSELFLFDFSYFFSYILSRINLFEKIIKSEKPSTIVVFDIEKKGESILISKYETLHREIIQSFWKGTVIEHCCSTTSKNQSIREKFFPYALNLQNVLANLCLTRDKPAVFLVGTKNMFKEIISISPELSFVSLKEHAGRSFSVNRSFVPVFTSNINNKYFKNISFNKEDFSISFNGFNLKDLLLSRKAILEKNYSESTYTISRLKKTLSRRNIKFVLLMSDVNYFEKLVAKISSQMKIPSAVLQHGITGHKIGFIPLTSEYFLAWGEESKEWMIRQGADKARIVIVGSPRFDDYPQKNVSSQKYFVYTPQLTQRGTIFPNYHVSLRGLKESLRILFKAMKKFPDYKIVITIRPDYNIGNLIDKIAKDESFANYSKCFDKDIISLLAQSSAVITHFSTIGIESLLLEKPLITINFKDQEFVPYNKLGASTEVSTSKELSSALHKSLKTPKNKNKLFLESYLANKGKASSVVKNFIKNGRKNKSWRQKNWRR